MTGSRDLSGEMPTTPPPAISPSSEEQAYDALLSGRPLPADAPERAAALGELLHRLATADDAADYPTSAAAAAFATYRAAHTDEPPSRVRSLSTKAVAVIAASLFGVGGVSAAYAGVLPERVQNIAHHLIHAPAPHRNTPARSTGPSPQHWNFPRPVVDAPSRGGRPAEPRTSRHQQEDRLVPRGLPRSRPTPTQCARCASTVPPVATPHPQPDPSPSASGIASSTRPSSTPSPTSTVRLRG